MTAVVVSPGPCSTIALRMGLFPSNVEFCQGTYLWVLYLVYKRTLLSSSPWTSPCYARGSERWRVLNETDVSDDLSSSARLVRGVFLQDGGPQTEVTHVRVAQYMRNLHPFCVRATTGRDMSKSHSEILVTSNLLLIWTALFWQTSGEKTSCVVRPVPAGFPTALTCFFNENLQGTGKEFNVKRLYNTGSETQSETVLDCYWVDDKSTCDWLPGYHFNGSFSDTLTLEIPNATASQVGNYECHVVPSTPGDQASCKLFLQELSTSTVPFVSTETETSEPSKEFEDAASGELTAGAIAGIVIPVLLIVLLAGLIYVWKFRDRIRKLLGISDDASRPTEEAAAQMENLKSQC